MPEKLKDLLRSKWFRLLLILPFLAIAIFITWPLPAIIFGDPILKAFVFIKLYWRTLIVFALLACAVVLFIIYLWPIVRYLCHKIFIYSSIRKACKSNKYKFKAIRMPFASVKGLQNSEDIRITTYKETYAVHFIDLLYPSRSGITVKDNEYWITQKSTKKKSAETKEFKHRLIPDFSSSKDVKHVFLVQSSKCETRIFRGIGYEILMNDEKFNSMVFYYAIDFVRFLRH